MASLGELVARMSLDISQFTGALNKVEQQSAITSRNISKSFAELNSNITGLVAGFLSISTAVETFEKAVERGANLDEMSKAFGVAVGDMDKLSLAMQLTGTDAGTLEKQFKSLSEQITLASNPASKSADLFKAMGVALVDAAGKARASNEIYQDTIKQLSAIEDPALRAAAAQQLFGRGSIAALKAAAEYDDAMALATKQLELFGTTSEETAKMAKDFKDQQILISDGMTRLMMPALKSLLPAFGDFVKAMSESSKGGTSMAETLGGAVATVFRTLATGAIVLVGGLKGIGIGLAGLAAAAAALLSGEGLAGMNAALAASTEDLKANSDATVKSALDMLGLGDAHNEAAAAAQRNAVDQEGVRKALNGVKEAAENTDPALKDLAKSYNKIIELAAQYDAGQANDSKAAKLDEQFAEINRTVAEVPDVAEAAGKAMEVLFYRMYPLGDAIKYVHDQTEQADKAEQDYVQTLYDALTAVDKQTQTMGDQLKVMGLIGVQRDLALSQIARQHALDAAAALDDKEKAEALTKEINLTYDHRDAMLAATDAAKTYQTQMHDLGATLGSGLTDVFETLLTKGKAGFKDLWDDFKSWAFKAMAEVAARQVVVSLVGSAAAGNAGAAENALTALFGGSGGTSTGSSGGLLTGLGNAFSVMSGSRGFESEPGFVGPPTSMAGGTGLFGVGSSGFSASGVIGGAGMGAGIGAGAAAMFGNERNQQGMQIGGMIGGIAGSFFGPIGSIVGSMIGSAIGSLVKSGGGAKTGGFAQTGTDVAGRYFTPSDLDSSVQKVVDTTASGYDSLVKALGGTSTAHFALGYDTDPKGTADSRVSVGVYGASGNELFKQGDVDAGRDDTTLQAKITQETQRALLAALQQSDLPDDIAKILDTVVASTASADDVTAVLTLANSFKNLMDVADAMKDPLTAATDALKTASETGMQAWEDQRTAFATLAETVPTTADGIDQLTTAANGLYQSTVQLLSGIIQAKQALSGMFDDTRTNILNAVQTPQQQYQRLQAQTQGLYDQLGKATDPADITRITGQINQNVNTAFGLLSPEQQKQSYQDFLTQLDKVDQLSQHQMDLAMQKVQDQAAADQATLQGTLNKILDGITGAGTDFKAGADAISKAVSSGVKVDVSVSDDRVTAQEVSG